MRGIKRVCVFFSFIVLISVLSVGFVLAYPTIDGSVSAGEWDDATNIYVAGSIGIVKVIATTDYVYVLFNVSDSTDARLGQNLKGNDQIGFNINPTDGGSWGFPYDIIFQTGADPNAWGGTSSGQTDGWETQWSIKVGGVTIQQPSLPSDLETKTIYSSGRRISEWKIPLVNITNEKPCDDLKVGGAIDVGDGNSYVYPVGLNWNDASTFVDIPVKDVKIPDTNVTFATKDDFSDARLCEDGWMYVNFDPNDIIVHFSSEDSCSNLKNVEYSRSGTGGWYQGQGFTTDKSKTNNNWYTQYTDDDWTNETYKVCGRAIDIANNQENPGNSGVEDASDNDCCMLCIDTTKPEMDSISDNTYDCSDEGKYWNQQNINWTWTAHDEPDCGEIDYYVVKLMEKGSNNSVEIANVSGTSWTNTNPLEDGKTYFVYVIPVDKAKNVGNAIKSDEVIIDLTDPEVEITGPDPDDWYDPSFIVTETDYDVNLDKCYYRIKNLKTDEYTLNWTETPCNENITIDPSIYCPDDGPYCKVYKKAIDKACNDKWTSEVFKIDTHEPKIEKEVGEPKVKGWEWMGHLVDWFITDETEITLICDDGNGSGVQAIYYKIDEGNWTRIDKENLSCGNSFTFNLEEDGIHTIEYYCIDKVNKTSEIKNETDKVDIEAPIVTKTYGLPSLLGYRTIQGINMLIHYITSQTTITLNAADEEVGVNETWWLVLIPCEEPQEGCMPEMYLNGTLVEWWQEEFNECLEENECSSLLDCEPCNITWWIPKAWEEEWSCPGEETKEGPFFGAPWCLYEDEEPITINQECDHKICYFSYDKLGNGNLWNIESEEDFANLNIHCQVFSVDNSGPEIIIHNPTEDEAEGILRCDQSIVAEIWDNKSGVNESSIYAELINESGEGEVVRNVTLTKAVYSGEYGNIYEGLMDKQLPAGEYTLKVYAKDNLGNEAEEEREETLEEGIYVEYLDPASCLVNVGEDKECTFTFHVCARGINWINMTMDKLGKDPGLITPNMLDARISKGDRSAYVGLTGVGVPEDLQLSEEKVNGKETFNLTLHFNPDVTSILGTGNYDFNYTINSWDP